MVLENSQKIGVGLLCLGLLFISLGVILMLDSAMIAIGNVLFLFGLYFSVGLKRTLALFKRYIASDMAQNDLIFTRRPGHIRGTVLFFLGALLVLFRWVLVGMVLEGFGFLNLFGYFLPTVMNFARQIPVLSTILSVPIIAHSVDFLVGKARSSKYSV